LGGNVQVPQKLPDGLKIGKVGVPPLIGRAVNPTKVNLARL
jgi:hypothetical protein